MRPTRAKGAREVLLVVVAWTKVVVVVETPRRWKAMRGVEDWDDVRRRKGEDGEEVKAMSWSRWKKDQLPPDTYMGRLPRVVPLVPRWGDRRKEV